METNEETRLRLFLQEYERVCKRYSLVIDGAIYKGLPTVKVFERETRTEYDTLPGNLDILEDFGVND